MSHDGEAIKQKAVTKTMSAPAICIAADAVGHEIDLSWGESRRDMVFYAPASEVAHGKKKPTPQKTPASMICTAAHAVGYEIGLPCTRTMPVPAICTAADAVGYEINLSCAESRRDIVFYAAAKGCPHKTYFVARIGRSAKLTSSSFLSKTRHAILATL